METKKGNGNLSNCSNVIAQFLEGKKFSYGLIFRLSDTDIYRLQQLLKKEGFAWVFDRIDTEKLEIIKMKGAD